ncbi:uncharacterized protein LOC62_07G009144 [Vanrija pseudolonga]|uniref:DUF676 domain-containing protein n=1 Tax=Vanrija pseudolonga TaxID=143232 RepID=A0AAF1BLY8_9TREE|nr:hypothetical protein LOC62_07G009144 [Vanrija pseudolonga]
MVTIIPSAPIKDVILLVWVHGFKGTDVTFEAFPERVKHVLEQTHPGLAVHSEVFPVYETRGELSAATEAFTEWLTIKVVELENNGGHGGGAGSAKVALLGHSMGGLLIADATARIEASTRNGSPMWPNVVATIAFDTPYLGLHPHVFKHQMSNAANQIGAATSAVSKLDFAALGAGALSLGGLAWTNKKPEDTRQKSATTQKSASPSPAGTPKPAATSSWFSNNKALVGIGALAALGVAAAGTAYMRRDDLAGGWKWGYDHMTFVKNLFDEEGMKARLKRIDELRETRNVVFANHFTLIPPKGFEGKRTFAIVPSSSGATADAWIPASNSRASDEVEAHTGMFNPRTNDGFYDLGLAVVRDLGLRLQETLSREPGAAERETSATASATTPLSSPSSTAAPETAAWAAPEASAWAEVATKVDGRWQPPSGAPSAVSKPNNNKQVDEDVDLLL